MTEKLASLFRGLQRAHGVYRLGKATKGGKVGGKAVTVMEPVTPDVWAAHVDGKVGLGIVPINDDAVCWFGAIDIDQYPLDLAALDAKVKDLSLPLVVCRTKSGGAHLYYFSKGDPVDAALLRTRLQEWAVLLGHAGCEVFPKQTRLASSADVGNWINMPYFNADGTERYAVHNGKQLTLAQFIARARKVAMTPAALAAFSPQPDDLAGAPPCLIYMATQGIPEGCRNSSMFNFLVYLRNRYPDTWQQEAQGINSAYMTPPLPGKELSVIIKSAAKKDYYYTCKQEPLCSHCNKEVCRAAEYGIGYGKEGEAAPIELGEFTKILTDPPLWIIPINGVRVEMGSDDILRQDRFRRLCMERINILPPRVKTASWEAMINDRLVNCEIVEAPDDAGPVGMFLHHLRQFCTGVAQAATRDEILNSKVWTEDGRHYFRAVDLMVYLDRQRFKALDQRKIWSILREDGAGHKTLTLKGVRTRVWHIAQFDEADGEFEVPQTDQSI